MHRRVIVIAQCILLSFMVGCGGASSQRAVVNGSVKFDGQPVETGMIALLPIEGTVGPSSGAEIKKGQYNIPKDRGPIPGKYRIEITATRSAGTIEVKGVEGATGGLSGSGTVNQIEMFIPDIYNTKSTLVEELKPGSNQKNFELKSAP
jgi:hypothetical protein